MPPSRIYNVKQAAKILGLSTNTTYKYLNEGRIRAARGHIRGTFIITAKSLEDFLGTKLSDNPLEEEPSNIHHYNLKDAEAVIEVSAPFLSLKVTRFLLVIIVCVFIGNFFTNTNSPFLSSALQILNFFLITLLIYQYGGFNPR